MNKLRHTEVIRRKPKPRERLYTPEKAAILLGVSTSTIRRWDRDGMIFAHRTPGGHRRIPQSVIDFILSKTRKDFPDLPEQPSKGKSPEPEPEPRRGLIRQGIRRLLGEA